MKIPFPVFFAVLLLLPACNKDDVITENAKQPPVIELDSETGIYSVKAGRELTIAPVYRNAENAIYAWTIAGKLVSSAPVLRYTWEQAQETYLKLRVDTSEGYAEEELKVEVLELTPPVISLVIPSKGLKVVRNTDYVFSPDIRHDDLDGFEMEWLRGGEVVSTDRTYTFREQELGTYPITIRAANIDGETVRNIDVEVVETMPYEVRFPTPSYAQTSTDRYTFAGRPVYLRPLLAYFDRPEFCWSVNGRTVEGAAERVFKFVPAEAGEYTVAVTVTEGASAAQSLSPHVTRASTSVTAAVKVVCEEQTEQQRYRAASASSSPVWNKVYEFTPAPGQFINELSSNTGFTGNETTPEQAVEYATKRLSKKSHVSLGSFGGYIVVGFDHSIRNSGGGYDFAVQGNAFNSDLGGSNEPGVVWVMQDVNGNGLPDDEWYELKGSETGKEGTIQDYEVTYYKPDGIRLKVPWTDSEGGNGYVDYNGYHTQEYYYPLWIAEKSYTLTGTRLSPRNNMNPVTGYWGNLAYGWGYADNMGSDNISPETADGSGQRNGFRISNAVFRDGTPAALEYIDFIKVQCGVLAQSGPLGEISTEVFSFEDLSMTDNQ